MKLKDSVHEYLNVFFFMGLSAHKHLKKNAGTYTNSMFLKLPVLVHSTVVFSLSMKCIIDIYADKSIKVFGQIDILIIWLYLFGNLVRSVLLLREGFIYHSHTKNILVVLEQLQHYILHHLKYKIPNQSFTKKYMRKCLMSMGLNLQFLVIYFVQCILDHWINSIGSPIRIVHLLSELALLHMIFYIDLLRFHFTQLNGAIQINMSWKYGKNVSRSTNIISFCRQLLHYKTIHFRLYEVAERVSEIFGCSLIVVLFEHFLCITYSMYWLFEEVNRKSSYYKILRKLTSDLNYYRKQSCHVFKFELFCQNHFHICCVDPSVYSYWAMCVNV